MYDSTIFSKRLKSQLALKGKTQKEMLVTLGLSINVLTRVTQHGIASGSLYDIAEYLGCSMDYLTGRTDKPEIQR